MILNKLLLLSIILIGSSSVLASAAEKGKEAETSKQAADVNKILAITAKLALDGLKADADKGDMASALALYDFMESAKDRKYKITYQASKDKLAGLGLLDGDKVRQTTVDALKAVGMLK